MADSDASSGGSGSSSSSDSVLIRVPLDQKRRKKLRAQLQADQRRQAAAPSPPPPPPPSSAPSTAPPAAARAKPAKPEPDSDRGKGEHICVVCEREGDALVVCGGPCISAFHARCLPPDSGAAQAQGDGSNGWLCPSCSSKTHACFHCKQTGPEARKDDAPAAAAAARPVRKCRALSCGKFYHQDCIAQFPLARIATDTHFICPLHTCAGCNQSGAQQEAVRCMRCPVAFHARCLPPGCARQISSKLILCPRHAEPRHKQLGELQARDEREDEAMSEASAVSASSARRREKREKRDKRDKKKKKKKKKKDKHKRESLASQADDEAELRDARDADAGGKKRKRSKRESLDADEPANTLQRGEKAAPSTPSGGRKEAVRVEAIVAPRSPAAATPGAGSTRSPTSALALFESPATATKRIQERLEEALGKSDDDSDESTASSSVKRKRSSSQIIGSQGDTASAGVAVPQDAVVKEERSVASAAKVDQDNVEEKAKSPVPSSPVPMSPAGDKDSLEARSSAEDSPNVKVERKKELQDGRTSDASRTDQREQLVEGALKLEIPKSPSASVLIPSASSGLVLKHVPSEDEDDDDEGTAGSATPNADATPRTPRGGRTSGPGKKRKKNKAKRESQRALKRETSEEEEEEANEAKWVQCDSCKKWRTVPPDFNLDAMPTHWYCNMNTWDERYASCAVAEEVLKVNPSPQVKKRKYKLKSRSKSTQSSTGDDGGYSSSGSGTLKRSGGSLKGSITDMTALEEKEKGPRSFKNKDKASKKRNITKQLKEKYREVKWVQCESTQCGKWRVVPTSINFDRLPAVWYCHLNTWAPELAKCSAPNPPEVDAFLLKQSKKDGSARPSKKARASSSTGDAAPAASVSVTSGNGMTPTSSANDLTSLGKSNSTKHGKASKVTVSGTGNGASNTGTGSNAEGGNSNNGSNTEGNSSGHSTKGRGGRGHSNSGANTSGIKKTVLEWAQCEKCNKWRKLPQHIKSSTLPDKWYCSMNHWDPSHAKCSVPEEADQEPVPLPPHPGSQWHKVGHKGQRPRRGKLSYSELLYGSTGQLRKAYTAESSTQSFEYEGTTYHRDDQYKHSSMYVSPAAMAAAATMAGWSGSDRVSRETNCSNEAGDSSKVDALAAATPAQANVDHVAALVLENMDLRRRRSVSELFEAVNAVQRAAETGTEPPTSGLASLAVVTAALGQLEHRGLVEKVSELSEDSDEDEPSRKRRKAEALFSGTFSLPTHYRKVPTRPLKASKSWKFGASVVSVSPLKES